MTNLELLEQTVQHVISANSLCSRGHVFNCYLPGSFIFGLQHDIISKFGPFINSYIPEKGFRFNSIVLANGSQLNIIEDNSRFHIELIKKG